MSSTAEARLTDLAAREELTKALLDLKQAVEWTPLGTRAIAAVKAANEVLVKVGAV